MNVLMVGPDMNEKGGIATVIHNFYDYYTGDNKLFYAASWRSNTKLSTFLKCWFSLRTIIRKRNIQVVHFHVAERGSFLRATWLKNLIPKDVKVIFHMHAAEFDIFYQNSSWYVRHYVTKKFNQIDLVVALSTDWQKFYKKLTNTEVLVMPNAVKVENVNQYNLNSSKVVTIGRIGKRKGTFDLLKVAQQLSLTNVSISFELYGDSIGDELDQVKKVITTEQINNVKIMGWLDNPQAIFKTAGLHFLPSYHEGVPMAILETMANGIPNLATDVGGVHEVITNGKNGIIDQPGDIKAMVDQILAFFSNKNLRTRLSNEAFTTIETRYSIAVIFNRWDKVYLNLVN